MLIMVSLGCLKVVILGEGRDRIGRAIGVQMTVINRVAKPH